MAAGARQPYKGPHAAPGRLGQTGLGEVCHKKLIDDMPKVSLSSHMNGLRSPPHFLRYLAPHSTLLLSTAIPKVELKAKQTALLSYYNSQRPL